MYDPRLVVRWIFWDRLVLIPLEGTKIFFLDHLRVSWIKKMAARAGLVPKFDFTTFFDILTYCRNDSYGYMSLGEGKVIIVQLILLPG